MTRFFSAAISEMYALAICPAVVQTASTMHTELWQRLRQARRYADMTQADLAKHCGVSRGAVALWEAAEPEHRTKPTTDHLIAVSKATRVPLEWLLNDASDINAVWRLNGEFGAPAPVVAANEPEPVPDVLPDVRQGDQLFVFAQTPQQIAAKLAQLTHEPPETKAHLILVGHDAKVHTAATPADALAAVVRVLTGQQ